MGFHSGPKYVAEFNGYAGTSYTLELREIQRSRVYNSRSLGWIAAAPGRCAYDMAPF
jgi:hypothetical protein